MLAMSEKLWARLHTLRQLEQGRISTKQGAEALGLSDRQVRYLRLAFEERGEELLVHGNVGRRPWNRLSDGLRQKIEGLRRVKYVGFNDHHFAEKLVEVERLQVSRRTVQRVLRAAGIAAIHPRRPPPHRRRRERKAQAGMMILWDGSPHDWLEARGPRLCLVGAVDDATGELLAGAHFVAEECTAGYLRALKTMAQQKGLPLTAYMDRHSVFKRNDDNWTLEEELRGEQDLTQVGRALEALAIEPIFALSPQAKGRVERMWGTLQGRLVPELTLAGACTAEEANVVLERVRLDVNRRFSVSPRDTVSVWRRVPKDVDLDRLCSFRYEATVRNDNTVRIGGTIIDVPPGPGRRGYPHARVEADQLLDGSWRVYYHDQLIATAPGSPLAGDLRALRHRKRPAASRAFRKAVLALPTTAP
jgi:hypothetical protein